MTLEETVNWLKDRAEISDMLFTFARVLDERDWDAYTAMYAPGGRLQLPWGEPLEKETIGTDAAAHLSHFHATQHISSNHEITIDGDRARSRSYVQALHVAEEGSRENHWTIGGRYDCDHVRTGEGWKFELVRLTSIWQLHDAPTWSE